jgi:hypothetical protein
VPVSLPQFAALVTRYCDWCEGEPGSAREEAETAFSLLVDLLAGVPRVQGGFAGGAGRRISDEVWKQMHSRFASLPFQYYVSWHNPLDLDDHEREMGDIADDLADVWRDLKPGLELYESNDLAAAAAEWQFGFEFHWGRHATAALYALHCWLVDNRPQL